MELPTGLLAEVKNYLDITWEDADGDQKLIGIISRGMSRINEIAGAELDYTAEDQPLALLCDYCMYARAGALSEFEENYLSELISLQIREAVKADEESEEATDV